MTELPLACKHCGHEWSETFRNPILLDFVWRKLRNLICPGCKASYKCVAVNFGKSSDVVPEIDTAAMRERVEARR
jgi:hypothetical protein